MTAAPIISRETVGSTMDEMAALLAAGPVEPWTSIIANYQSAGRGRVDRSWQAEPGSSLLATIYCPISIDPVRAGMLAIASGVALADALAEFGVDVRLKWPNDVLVDDRKLAGILITTRIGDQIEASIGIGLNVMSAPGGAVCLNRLIECPPPPIELLEAIQSDLKACWQELERGRFAQVRDRWNEIAAWVGEVVAAPGDDPVCGRLMGIDDWGRLRVATASGEITLSQSEVVRGPVPVEKPSYTSR